MDPYQEAFEEFEEKYFGGNYAAFCDEYSNEEVDRMQDWQIAVLNSENLRIDQDQYTGYRLVIRKTDKEHRMSIPAIVATVRKSKRKPVIMCPDEPFRGMFADRKEVLDILMSTPDYENYAMFMAEAKMNGVI